jgi:hypothetical protein
MVTVKQRRGQALLPKKSELNVNRISSTTGQRPIALEAANLLVRRAISQERTAWPVEPITPARKLLIDSAGQASKSSDLAQLIHATCATSLPG